MKEIDALDGVCSKICGNLRLLLSRPSSLYPFHPLISSHLLDLSGIQYKVLNTVKGPAVWVREFPICEVLECV